MNLKKSGNTVTAFDFTPLIDLVFLLIIFFMFSTNFSNNGNIELSAVSSGEAGGAVKPDDTKRLLKLEGDNMLIDGTIRDSGWVRQWVKDQFGSEDDPVFSIQTSRNTNVQQLVGLIDLLRQSGAVKIQLVN